MARSSEAKPIAAPAGDDASDIDLDAARADRSAIEERESETPREVTREYLQDQVLECVRRVKDRALTVGKAREEIEGRIAAMGGQLNNEDIVKLVRFKTRIFKLLKKFEDDTKRLVTEETRPADAGRIQEAKAEKKEEAKPSEEAEGKDGVVELESTLDQLADVQKKADQAREARAAAIREFEEEIFAQDVSMEAVDKKTPQERVDALLERLQGIAADDPIAAEKHAIVGRMINKIYEQQEKAVSRISEVMKELAIAQEEYTVLASANRESPTEEGRARFKEKSDRLAELENELSRLRQELPETPTDSRSTVRPEVVQLGEAGEEQALGAGEQAAQIEPPQPAPSEVAATQPTAPEGRRLLNAAKLREQFASDEVGLALALGQAKFAERRGVYADKQVSLMIESAIRGLSGEQQFAFGVGEAALDTIALQVGLERAQVQEIFDRQRAALEDRARREVSKESREGVKILFAKGGIYVGFGILLNRIIPGLGAASAAVRMADTWTRGTRVERKVQERIAEYQAQLAEGVEGENPAFTRELFADIAAEIAGMKQDQIDRRSESRDGLDPKARAEAAQESVARYIGERYPELSPEQQSALVRGAGALEHLDTVQRQLEFQFESRAEPGKFGRLVNALDKFFGSKWVRGGETGKEKALTAGVFAVAGVLAREVPILRNILFGYTGLKIGEAAGMSIVKRAGRYDILKPVTSADLSRDDVTREAITKARLQIADAKFREQNPAEAAKLRELVDRHEERLINGAQEGADHLAQRTSEMRDGLTKKLKVEREAKVVVNGTRIAGAALGAFLGPMAVEWIAQQFQKAPVAVEQSKAAPTEAIPSPKAEVDPKMLELARIHRGDGATQVFQRQLEANPKAFGYTGEASGAKAWAFAESKRLAIAQGYLAPDGRTTHLGLQFKEGSGLQLTHEGGATVVKPIGNVDTYIANRALGFETPRVAEIEPPSQEQPFIASAGSKEVMKSDEEWVGWGERPASPVGGVTDSTPGHEGSSFVEAKASAVGAGGVADTAAESGRGAGAGPSTPTPRVAEGDQWERIQQNLAQGSKAIEAVGEIHERANWDQNIQSIPEHWWEGVSGYKVWTSADGKVTFAVGESVNSNPTMARLVTAASAGRLLGMQGDPVGTRVVDYTTYQIFAIPTELLPKKP